MFFRFKYLQSQKKTLQENSTQKTYTQLQVMQDFLAPIVVKILMGRCSAYKIATDSGKSLQIKQKMQFIYACTNKSRLVPTIKNLIFALNKIES